MKTQWLAAGLLSIVMVTLTLGQDDLATGFREPPASAQPHTWWHWMNGNITPEGITADLESMARVGIGGAQIFNVGDKRSTNIPAGPIEYMTPAWLELVLHAAREAERLGLELCLHNCAGWTSSGGPWITPEYSMQKVVWSEVEVAGPVAETIELPQPPSLMNYYRDIAVLAFPTPKNKTFRIADVKVKAGFERRYNLQPEPGPIPDYAVITLESIIDLTDKLDGKGRLAWQAPAGHWTILRLGHTSTGKTNHPAPISGRGLECDKLSRAALDLHWTEGVQPVVDKLGPLAGKVLNNILVDSYEVRLNNWSPRMRDEFRARRDYDLWLYLPALTGRVVADGAVTERFLWDFRRTIADLIADNYYGYFVEKCHAQGLLCSIEPYHGPFECMAVGAQADILMGEFWVGRAIHDSVKLAASVAHTHGRTLVGAESFTSRPADGRWLNHPGSLKSLGELIWCSGVNRYIFHRYAHQPWLDKFPGMTMGQWGSHFERTNTWWEQSRAWMAYIARSQFLLQQGRFVADVLFFAGESAPNSTVNDPALRAAGYDFDVCGTDLIDDLRVADGMVELPSGMRYRVLVLRDTQFMSPALAVKVRDLVRAGATVISQRPDCSPSLTGYPQCDAQVKAIAQEVWGEPGATVGKHSFGKGQIVWGQTPLEVLRDMSVVSDCAALDTNVNLAYIHRVVGDSDVYFVCQKGAKSKMVDCFFRVTGKRPELWNPVTGAMQSAGLWQTVEQGTRVTLPFGPQGSWFVVFRKPLHPSAVTFTTLHNEIPTPIATLLPKPQHKLEITAATYGVLNCNGKGMVDVTEKLKAQVKNNRLEVVASNKLAGDPLPNIVKTLYVDYEYDGKPTRAQVSEGQQLVLPPADLPVGRPLRIVMAGYGKLAQGQDWLPVRKSVDVTAQVSAAVKDNTLRIKATNELADKDPAYGIVKQLRVCYQLDSEACEVTVSENQELQLPETKWLPSPWLPETTSRRQGVQMVVWDNGRYRLQTSDGAERSISVETLPAPMVLNQPWTAAFTPGWGAPARIELPHLIDLTQHADPGVRYYSGTVTYETVLHLPPTFVQKADRLCLDLGQVQVLAEVIVNGTNLGILWCAPFRVDITAAAQPGDNTLEVRVTNLWVNRLIGDEQYPDDSEWNGKPLKAWPTWLQEEKPRPSSQRLTFTTWKHWTKDNALLPSGLLGPVYLRAGKQIEVDR